MNLTARGVVCDQALSNYRKEVYTTSSGKTVLGVSAVLFIEVSLFQGVLTRGVPQV